MTGPSPSLRSRCQVPRQLPGNFDSNPDVSAEEVTDPVGVLASVVKCERGPFDMTRWRVSGRLNPEIDVRDFRADGRLGLRRRKKLGI